MKKKAINPFNISFLDLLSSALAAVIILFVIVPKSKIPLQWTETQMDSLKIQTLELDSVLDLLSANMSEKEIAWMLARSDKIKQNLVALEQNIKQMKTQLEAAQEKSDERKELIERQERRIAILKKALAKQKTQQASIQVERKQTSNTPQSEQNSKEEWGPGMRLFGFNPVLVAQIEWEDTDADVDLYLRHDNRFCDEQNRMTPFGRWVKIPRRLITQPTEAIIQQELVTGEYELYAHMYRPREGSVEVSGYIAMQPEEGPPKRVDLGEITIGPTPPPYRDGGTLIGRMAVTEKGFDFSFVK